MVPTPNRLLEYSAQDFLCHRENSSLSKTPSVLYSLCLLVIVTFFFPGSMKVGGEPIISATPTSTTSTHRNPSILHRYWYTRTALAAMGKVFSSCRAEGITPFSWRFECYKLLQGRFVDLHTTSAGSDTHFPTAWLLLSPHSRPNNMALAS
ncbi:hypothetical protein EDC04DRAFT_2006165 [Pisolithus marmoratus]|nr:hypothetical protein EDC04DRAFT_2006165 [Pisolithus marmoratus]